MKPTDFAVRLTAYLTHYLAAQRNLSPNTIKAYRDVFTLLLRFCRDARGLPPERLRIEDLDVPMVEGFLEYLGTERHCRPSTCNQRLAALHAFFRYLQSEEPERILQCQKILAMPIRKLPRPSVGYLSEEHLTTVLAQPDTATRYGRRDAVMLSLLYDSGARVQELVDLSVRDVRLDTPAHVRLSGKGRKMRAVPLIKSMVEILGEHLLENGLNRPEHGDEPLFTNRKGGRLSRSGIRHILGKYVEKARGVRPTLRQKVSPHTLRHSKGMHLVECGIPLEYIRDMFGHSDCKTTQIYARANLEMKKKALESVGPNSATPKMPTWQEDKNLMDWLRSL